MGRHGCAAGGGRCTLALGVECGVCQALAQGRGVPLLLCAPHIHSPAPAPWPAARSNFTNHNKLKREAMKVIASCMPADEIAGLAEIFKNIDADGSGEGRRWLAEVGAEGGSQAAHGVR